MYPGHTADIIRYGTRVQTPWRSRSSRCVAYCRTAPRRRCCTSLSTSDSSLISAVRSMAGEPSSVSTNIVKSSSDNNTFVDESIEV